MWHMTQTLDTDGLLFYQVQKAEYGATLSKNIWQNAKFEILGSTIRVLNRGQQVTCDWWQVTGDRWLITFGPLWANKIDTWFLNTGPYSKGRIWILKSGFKFEQTNTGSDYQATRLRALVRQQPVEIDPQKREQHHIGPLPDQLLRPTTLDPTP